MLMKNVHGSSVVAQKQVHDGIRYRGSVLKIGFLKSIFKSVRKSHSRFQDQLETNEKTLEG